MAKRRMIDPSIWDDPDIGELSGDAFRLFVGLFSNADDEGRIEADPRQLKKVIFGYRADVKVADVVRLRADLCKQLASLVLYRASSKEYIAFRKWKSYQNVPKDKFVASRLPEPPCPVSDDAFNKEGDTEGMPEGYPSDTEGVPDGLLDKVKLNKIRLEEDVPTPAPAFIDFESFWAEFKTYYPAREGRREGIDSAAKDFARDILKPAEWGDVIKATRNYAGEEFPVDPIRFFKSREYPNGKWRGWVNAPAASNGLGKARGSPSPYTPPLDASKYQEGGRYGHLFNTPKKDDVA